MKTLLRIALLALTCAVVAPRLHAEERVVVVRCDIGEDPSLGRVDLMLAQGWTIKLVTSCMAVCNNTRISEYSNASNRFQVAYFTFVLYRPDPAKATPSS